MKKYLGLFLALIANAVWASTSVTVDRNGNVLNSQTRFDSMHKLIVNGVEITGASGGYTLPGASARGLDKDIWIANRVDGQDGSGAQEDPLNAGANLGATILAVAGNNRTVHLAGGTYTSHPFVVGAHNFVIKGDSREAVTIQNSDATLGASSFTSISQQPFIYLIGDDNAVAEVTLNGNRGITPVGNSAAAVVTNGNRCRIYRVRATNFRGGDLSHGFSVAGAAEAFPLLVDLGNDNIIDSCIVDDFVGYATLISAWRGTGAKIVNCSITIDPSLPYNQRPAGYNLYASGIFANNTSQHTGVGFNADTGSYGSLTMSDNRLENCHSSAIRIWSQDVGGLGAITDVKAVDNFVSLIEDADGWPAFFVGNATRIDVSHNTLVNLTGASSVPGLQISSTHYGVVNFNTQSPSFYAGVSSNSLVTFQDNMTDAGDPMLLSDGTPIPGNVITRWVGTNTLVSSSTSVAVTGDIDFVRSQGTAAVVTLPAIGTGVGQARPNKSIMVRNEFGGSPATVKTATGTTIATVATGQPISFRAISSGTPDIWTPNYVVSSAPLMAGNVAQAAAGTTGIALTTAGTSFIIGNGGTFWFQLKNSSGSPVFGIFSQAGAPVGQQTGDVATGLGASSGFGFFDNAAYYSASKVNGRLANGNMPLGAQFFDSRGTPKESVDFAGRVLVGVSGIPTTSGAGGPITWNDGQMNIYGPSINGSAQVLIDVSAVDNGDNALWLYGVNGNPAFHVDAHGTLSLADDDTGGIAFQAFSRGYHNFGSSLGSAGYGFRDNSGIMQFKNSNGSWNNILSAPTAHAITFASTLTPDAVDETESIGPITSDFTIANMPAGSYDSQRKYLRFVENGTGSHVKTWGTIYKFASSSPNAGDVPNGANSVCKVELMWDAATSKWWMVAVTPDMQ